MCYSVNRSCYTIKKDTKAVTGVVPFSESTLLYLLGSNMYTLDDMCLQGTKMDLLGTKVYLLKR